LPVDKTHIHDQPAVDLKYISYERRRWRVASAPQSLYRIRIVWWACFGAVFIYSILLLLLNHPPLGEGVSALHDLFKMTFFLLMLILALICSALPFTLFDRRYLQKRRDHRQVVRSALLRMAFAEVAVILGVNLFIITKSYELYLIFFLISMLDLLLLKGDEGFYRDLLSTLG